VISSGEIPLIGDINVEARVLGAGDELNEQVRDDDRDRNADYEDDQRLGELRAHSSEGPAATLEIRGVFHHLRDTRPGRPVTRLPDHHLPELDDMARSTETE
jgi:hypothetical protein